MCKHVCTAFIYVPSVNTKLHTATLDAVTIYM
eukprot:SAG31_NODE_39_length_31377_cov_5.971482_4_plen_32_part_00